MDFGPFQQFSLVAELFEALTRDERIMDAVDLARTARPRRHRNRQRKIELFLLQQHAREAGLSGAGGRREDQHETTPLQAIVLMRCNGHEILYSIFWICSRNCSISTRNSSPIAVKLASFDLAHRVFRLTGEFLSQKIEPPSDRAALRQKFGASGDMGFEPIEFFPHVGLGREQQGLLIEPILVKLALSGDERNRIRQPRTHCLGFCAPDNLPLLAGAV